MVKAFISHSSVQKDFVKELVEILGRDLCIVDCYNFEPAYKTLDEIYRKIDQSSVFVLLLSKDSIESDWVSKEIRYAKTKLSSSDYDRFWPYIVDENLQVEECPEWIKTNECFNLKKFKSPIMLARDIEQKFRRIIWEKNKKQKAIDTLMVGRNADIDKFETLYQSAKGRMLKALVVSGREGVGKDTFIKQCLMKIGYGEEFEPFNVGLGNKEGIENLILQLNGIVRRYNNEQVEEVLSRSASEKAQEATSLLNAILDAHYVVSINDDMACVQPNRHVSDWLLEMVENSNMNNQMGLFIKSKKCPTSFLQTEHPSFGHLNLEPLDAKDRTKLFYSLLRIYGINTLTDDDVKWFVDRLLLSPIQIIKAVEALSRTSLSMVKKDIDSLVTWGDRQIKPFVSTFLSDTEQRDLLIIMSKFDFVSYEILEKIFEERIIEIMEKINNMMDFGVVSNFGPNEQYFRLDHYFSDYIKRCHLSMSADLEMLLDEVLEDKIAKSNDITEDASAYLYDKKQRIILGKGDNKDFLIPSVVITSIIEIYNKQDYSMVIKICDTVLSDVHNYFENQERELRYWLCLALAIQSNERFFEEVKHLKGADYSFLQGFYYRHTLEYPKAESWYKKTLEQSPDMPKAKREMVTVLLAQNKFEQALKLAEDNYKYNPDNSYQIHGYFRCLVRKRSLNRDDIVILDELLSAMKGNLSDKKEELLCAMNIEYQQNVNHKKPSEMLDIIREAESQYPNSINVKRAAQFFRYKQELVNKIEKLPED